VRYDPLYGSLDVKGLRKSLDRSIITAFQNEIFFLFFYVIALSGKRLVSNG